MNDIVTQAPKNLDYNNRFFKDNKSSLNKFDYVARTQVEQKSEKLERGSLSSSKNVMTTKSAVA